MAGEWTLPGIGDDLMSSAKFGERRLKTASSIVDAESGNSLSIDSEGKAKVVLGVKVDNNNSTFTPLLANATLAGNAVQNLLVVTPNTEKWAHMVVQATAEDGAVIFETFEDAVTSSNGTRDNERNRNRNSPDNNTTLVYLNPTITSVGSSLGSSKFGSGKTSGGGGRDSEEVILKQNTKYVFRITNATVSSNTVNWVLDWYEHTNILPPN